MGILNTLSFINSHPLGRLHRLRAVRRWLAWQVGGRMAPGPVVVGFVNDAVLLVSPGMTGATGNIYAGLHEFHEMSFVLHLLREGDVFVDVGANVGAYTVLAGAVAGARCVAVEPMPEAFAHLQRNINLNGIRQKVTAHNVGAGAVKSLVKFTSGLDTTNHALAPGEGERLCREAPVERLDSLLAGLSPLLIKVDVEGYESEVVAGAEATFSRESLLAVVMETNGSGARYGVDESALHARMLRYGFKPCAYSPFRRALRVIGGASPAAGNTLYVRDVEAARERLESAPAFKVNGLEI